MRPTRADRVHVTSPARRVDLTTTLARRVVPRFLRPHLQRVRYWGRKHECPVCGSHVRRYLPEGYDFPVLRELDVVGGEFWPDRTCPVCHVNTRSRLVWWYVQRETRLLTERASLLHLAPEVGLARRFAKVPTLAYHPADRVPSLYAFAGPICQLDATALPFGDARFDAVFANHVLEHIEDDARALSEIRRVLKPGGFALLQVPIAQRLARTLEDASVRTPDERERAYGQDDHVRLYGLDYGDRLAGAGFALTRYTGHVDQGPDFLARWALNPREVLYVATRA